MATQQEVGILSEHRPRLHTRDRGDSDARRLDLEQQRNGSVQTFSTRQFNESIGG